MSKNQTANRPSFISLVGVAAAAVGLALVASPAFAGNVAFHTETVSVEGIDLNTAEGQRIMERRINEAVRHVCQADNAYHTAMERSSARKCAEAARSDAHNQVAALRERQKNGA